YYNSDEDLATSDEPPAKRCREVPTFTQQYIQSIDDNNFKFSTNDDFYTAFETHDNNLKPSLKPTPKPKKSWEYKYDNPFIRKEPLFTCKESQSIDPMNYSYDAINETTRESQMTEQMPTFTQQYIQSIDDLDYKFSDIKYDYEYEEPVNESQTSDIENQAINVCDIDVNNCGSLQIVNRHKWTNTDYWIGTGITLKDMPQHKRSRWSGLVFGHLQFQNTNGVLTDCLTSPNGIAIPNDTERLSRMQSNAIFVLIVEKDATFQQLIDLKIHLKYPLIMVTGHGYPDMNTRAFIHILWNTFSIPIFGLVDGDAHGLEILCTFRHGSLALSYESPNLVVPAIKWLGILPTDIRDYRLSPNVQIPLKANDIKKIEDLKKRKYMLDNIEWTKQLNKDEF
ncbi:unnamed protein product, partial [Medioppia subpectinata]